MTTYFLDTSALMKAFIEEAGSDNMITLLERTADQFKAASALTAVELRSAIRRRQHSGDITDVDSDTALQLARDEARRMVLHPASDSVLNEAMRLIDVQQLRSLDAVQLATALAARERAVSLNQSLIFVASDKRLLLAARSEGFETWNPERDTFTA